MTPGAASLDPRMQRGPFQVDLIGAHGAQAALIVSSQLCDGTLRDGVMLGLLATPGGLVLAMNDDADWYELNPDLFPQIRNAHVTDELGLRSNQDFLSGGLARLERALDDACAAPITAVNAALATADARRGPHAARDGLLDILTGTARDTSPAVTLLDTLRDTAALGEITAELQKRYPNASVACCETWLTQHMTRLRPDWLTLPDTRAQASR